MRIVKMIIKNFRGINLGDTGHGVELTFDDNNIVFVCGNNNAGKSTLLSAYEMFVVADKKAEAEDFFGKNENNNIEIEAWVRAETQADRDHRALNLLWDGDGVARIKKVWTASGGKGVKYSLPPGGEWQEGGAGGFDTLLQNACPTPVWIKGSSTPDEIVALLRSLIQETILKNFAGQKIFQDAVDAIKNLESAIAESDYAVSLQRNLNQAIASVFPSVSFKLRNDGKKDIEEIFKGGASIDIQEENRPDLSFVYHGHGVRRQFVMSAFRGLAMQLEEVKKVAKQRKAENLEILEIVERESTSKSKMLLIEEPELFLHPEAIRSVRELVYLLAGSSEFQVMAATHSPIMVDLSKPHTTLVRAKNTEVTGTVLYQVSNSLFDDEDRERMKMLNYFDPYVCEAFFSDNVLLVEGDTEAVAIRKIIDRMRGDGMVDQQIHVVNCGTKMNIPFFQKVLTHFKIKHWIFHDVDSRNSSDGSANPAWAINRKIWEGIEMARQSNVEASRFVFNSEFESANGYSYNKTIGKPYSAYKMACEWDLADSSKPAVKYIKYILGIEVSGQEHSQDFVELLA